MEQKTFEDVLEEYGIPKKPKQTSVLSNKRYLTIGVVVFGIMLLSSFSVFAYITQENKSKNVIPEDVKQEVSGHEETIVGEVICVQEQTDKPCTLAIKTKSNDVFALTNKPPDLIEGKKVTIKGTVTTSKTTQSQAVTKEITVSSVKSDNASSPGNQSSTPTPIQSVPSPTPQPTNINEIIDNAENLEGQIVNVSGYLVNGNIGEEACSYLGICDYSVITVNNSANYDRDQTYDVNIIMNTSEKEENYSVGQHITMQARVTIDSGTVVLEKVY